jgi:hypothetical protein
MPKPPFTKDEMLGELRRIARVMVNHLAVYGSLEAAKLLTGFETHNDVYPYAEDDLSKFDLSRFEITEAMVMAYDYAFQVGARFSFNEYTVQHLDEFRHGANMRSTDGVASPMSNPDSMCRMAIDTALARWQVEQAGNLTIRELALLSDMKEAAVRNSLSAEGIKVETRRQGEPGTVDGVVAYGWLRKRRGFIDSLDPTMKAENRRASMRALFQERDFAWAFGEILGEAGISSADLAAKADVDVAFVSSLSKGKPSIDVEAARRVAKALGLDVPIFVGAVVEAALSPMA